MSQYNRLYYNWVPWCSKETHMPNIKITAEIDGKQVPLETVSTETFEAIKALEKPKEIPVPVPVARVGHWYDDPTSRRLFLKVTDSIKNITSKATLLVIDLKTGRVVNWCHKDAPDSDFSNSTLYENIQPL